MKKLILFFAVVVSGQLMAQSGLIKKVKTAVSGEKENNVAKAATTTGDVMYTQSSGEGLTLDQLIQNSPKYFEAIKGTKTGHDDYGFAGDTYTVTRCLAGSSKCVLQQTGFDATLKIRLGADRVSWEEAQKIFEEWYPKVKSITEWGKSAETFSSESYKNLTAEFIADRNFPVYEKYKNLTVQLRTYYFTETEFQVVLTLTN